MRKLGLDFGERSLGIAVSDPSNTISQGVANLRFVTMDFLEYTKNVKIYLSQYDIDTIVIGYPLYLDGNESKTSKLVKSFGEFLSSHINQKIIFVDEGFSTQIAHETMIKADISRKKRKIKKDKLAAQIILQNYLDSLSK